MTKRTSVLNVRLPGELINFLDSLVSEGKYSSRSEAVREFSREFVLNGGDNNVR